MNDYKEITDRIIEALKYFEDKLVKELGLNSPIVESFERKSRNELITYFGKLIIDNEFKDSKIAMLEGATKLIKELQDV